MTLFRYMIESFMNVKFKLVSYNIYLINYLRSMRKLLHFILKFYVFPKSDWEFIRSLKY